MDITKLTFDDRDEFSRKPIAEKAINLLVSNVDISPMVIDGAWGAGKTEFCHKFINLFKETHDTHNLVYIDAFKADHANEPLLTILAAIVKLLPKNKKQAFIKKVIPALRYTVKVSAKAGMAHLLRQDFSDVVDDFDKTIQKTFDKGVDITAENLLKDHVDADKNIIALQTAIHQVASEKPIVLFIDELDRCRPNFAINLLETIKHTFSIENLQIVMVTNTIQLRAAVKNSYGNSIDAKRYLDKFIKFVFTLPIDVNTDEEPTSVSIGHYKNLLKNTPRLSNLKLDKELYLNLAIDVLQVNQVSLREAESLIRNLEIFQISTNDEGLAIHNTYGHNLLRFLAILITTYEPTLKNQILSYSSDAVLLSEFLGRFKTPSLPKNRLIPDVSKVLSVVLGLECKFNSEQYSELNSGRIDKWKNEWKKFFRMNSPESDEVDESNLEIVRDALKAMSLGT